MGEIGYNLCMEVLDVIKGSIVRATGVENVEVESAQDLSHGDYTTNVALKSSKEKGKNPKLLAEEVVSNLSKDEELSQYISKVEVAGPGFINFWLKDEVLSKELSLLHDDGFKLSKLERQKIMVEYGHPNTHKELHIGHMRTLVVGESVSRLLEAGGAEVFRANYQGDIGPHVAKSIWGTTKLLKEKEMSWDEAEKLSDSEKAHLLGQGYAYGNEHYEENKEEINAINKQLYEKTGEIYKVYERTRGWSLKYYDNFYGRFDTEYNKLYFESDTAGPGKQRVLENVGKVFDESEGAVIFDGEKQGLHKRVFITKDGNPTYEGKDIGLAFIQYEDFQFDKNVHVVASEQAGYFKVVFAALSEIEPKFKDKEYHLSMGMVNLVGRKMSSRSGEVYTVDELLDDIKTEVEKLIDNKELSEADKKLVAEQVTMAAIKYSILQVNATQDVQFDIKTSVSLEGNSGPYIQYTHARAKSVIRPSLPSGPSETVRSSSDDLETNFIEAESLLARQLSRFYGEVVDAAKNYSPNILCNYLYQTAQMYNKFYNDNRIVGDEREKERLYLTQTLAKVLEKGLILLAIEAPEKM